MEVDTTVGFWQRPVTRLALTVSLIGLALALPNRYALTIFHEANTAGRVYAVQSLVHYDTWSLAPILCRTGPNHGLIDLSVRNGRPLLQKAPGMSWLGLPVYAVASWLYGGKLPFHQAATLLGLLCSWLPALALLWFLGRRWQESWGGNWGLVAVVGLLLGSAFWTYLPMFMDYALASLLLPAGWFAWRRNRVSWHVVGGLLVGLAGVINYMFVVYGLGLTILHLLWRWRQGNQVVVPALAIAAGGIGPAVALVAYHWVVWGHPLATAYDFMAHDVHKAMHGAAGFSIGALLDSLVHPKLGLLFASPWTIFGFAGLIMGWRSTRSREQVAAGLLMTVVNIGFLAIWRGANTDDLAFNRHALPMLPWLAMGLAAFGTHARQWPTLWSKTTNWALAATIAVAFFYQFVTAWTYPYHHDALDSPLWQVNLPLFANGFLLPVLTVTPVMRETLDTLGQGLWWWVAASAGLVVLALTAARIGAGKRVMVKQFVALPATFVAVLIALVLWGMASDSAGPEAQDQGARAAAQLEAGERPSPEALGALEAVSQAARYYEMASTDVHGSYFTPQDVLWEDAGYPQTNKWCGAK